MSSQLTREATHGALDGRGSGMVQGVGAYAIWGLFPAFFGMLNFAAPADILAHRVLWTMALMLGIVVVGRRLGELRRLPARTWLLVAAGAVSISLNWGIYVVAVLTGHVAEAALGYFINPLVSVTIGIVVFRERVRPAGIAAIILASIAVIVLTVGYHRLPVIALSLAASFAVYGVVKKLTPLPPEVSLTAETLSVAPLAVGYLAWLAVVHPGQLVQGPGHFVLLALCGPMTAVPLLLFGAAARRLPIVSIGVLQYITPILQFLWAVAVRHEHLTTTSWIGFVLIWTALVIFTGDAVHDMRRRAATPR